MVGVDALQRWSAGERLSGWVAYSLLRGRVTLEDRATVPSRTDVTHGLTAVGKLAIGQTWELGTTARFATGRPYTPVLGADDSMNPASPTLIYGATHAERMPSYRRLDMRLTRIAMLGDRPVVSFLELLNVLDRPNVMDYTWSADGRERRPIHSFFAHRVAMLGIEVQIR